jgi:hypothetical protein
MSAPRYIAAGQNFEDNPSIVGQFWPFAADRFVEVSLANWFIVPLSTESHTSAIMFFAHNVIGG